MGLLRKRTRGNEDRQFVGRTSDPTELHVASALGSRVVDTKGRSYIDFTSGWCVGNLGWNHPRIAERLRDFSGPSYVSPSMIYEPWIELAKRLAAVTGQARAFRAVGGTDAVEQALQIAATSTGRHKFVSLEGAYHGNSFAAHSIGEKLDIAIPSCKHLATPLDGRALERLDTLLKARDVAAFILEPIAMNLGVEVPTIEFMRGARQLCDRYGTLLVFDEVACGFGRTGKMFAAEHYSVLPDIVTLAKALSNGAVPIAATLTTADVADSVRGEMSFYSTFAWVPLAVEAALAVLDIWDDDRDTLLANIERRSGEFVSRLLAMPWKREVDIRVKGLAIAVEVDEAEQIVERARKRGLIIGEEDDVLQLFPPLVLNDDDAAEGLEILERAISG